jgi:hypothetical protein
MLQFAERQKSVNQTAKKSRAKIHVPLTGLEPPPAASFVVKFGDVRPRR